MISGRKIIADISGGVALGDTVLRSGVLRAIQSQCKELFVLSEKPDVLREAGVNHIISKNDIPALLPDIDDIIMPPQWVREGREQWHREQRVHRHLCLIENVMDSDYRIDQGNDFEYDGGLLNQVTRNFFVQVQRYSHLSLTERDVVPTSVVHPYSSPNLIAIGDNASVAHKCWPHYAGLVDRIVDEYPDARFAFVDVNTGLDAQRIATLRHPQAITYSANRDDPSLTVHFMRASAYFIGNDSGPAHYFSMLHAGDAPMLTLFSNRVDPRRWVANAARKEFLYCTTQGGVVDSASYSYDVWQRDFDVSSASTLNDLSVDAVLPFVRRMLAHR